MDGDRFDPRGFVFGSSVALAGIGCALVQAGMLAHNDVANVIAEHREADAADRVNSSMFAMLQAYDEAMLIVRRQGETIDSMAADIELLAALCEQQAAELAPR